MRGFVADTGRHFAGDYRLIAARLGLPGDDVSSDSFAKHQEFAEGNFTLPVFLLAIGQFTRTRFAEIVGVNLAWQWLGLSAFGPNLIAQGCRHFDLPAIGDDLLADGYAEKGRELAKAAAVSVLEDLPESEREAGFAKLRLLRHPLARLAVEPVEGVVPGRVVERGRSVVDVLALAVAEVVAEVGAGRRGAVGAVGGVDPRVIGEHDLAEAERAVRDLAVLAVERELVLAERTQQAAA